MTTIATIPCFTWMCVPLSLYPGAKLGKEPVDSPFSNGVALHQLANSLNLAFPAEASLTLASELGSGTEVVLTLPKIRSDER